MVPPNSTFAAACAERQTSAMARAAKRFIGAVYPFGSPPSASVNWEISQLQASQPGNWDEQPAPRRQEVPSGHSFVSPHENAPLQVASHEHDSLHLIRFLHERSPEHVTSHA